MNEKFMEYAIELARNIKKEIPVGALIVKDNEIIASAVNQKEEKQDATLHAEIVAIKEVSQKFGNWRLDGCDMYVTLEPCPMCAWAILQTRIANVYFGSYDNLYGAFGSKIDLRNLLNSSLKVKGGICEEECNKILNDYFEKMRNDKN